MGNNGKRAIWIQRLREELQRDKKRTAVLAVLVAIALIVAVRTACRGGPSVAVAVSGAPSQGPITPSGNRAKDDQIQKEVRRNDYLKRMDTVIARDVFRPNLEYFPTQKRPQIVRVLPTTTSSSADAKMELERQLIRAEAKSLVLQSTMVGDSTIAVLNGKVLRVGDECNGFRVMEITSQGCVVVKKGVRATLAIHR